MQLLEMEFSAHALRVNNLRCTPAGYRGSEPYFGVFPLCRTGGRHSLAVDTGTNHPVSTANFICLHHRRLDVLLATLGRLGSRSYSRVLLSGTRLRSRSVVSQLQGSRTRLQERRETLAALGSVLRTSAMRDSEPVSLSITRTRGCVISQRRKAPPATSGTLIAPRVSAFPPRSDAADSDTRIPGKLPPHS